MKTTINQLAILDRAKTMVLKGYNLNDSLTTSSMIELLQLKMMNGVSHFLYRKKDGTIREAWGTLLEKVVINNINGYGEPKRYYNCQAYFDIENQSFRSFRYENLITILD
ncbi:MAG: SH3 beta-barrel fold-containing protein [Dysgonomonas sp.]